MNRFANIILFIAALIPMSAESQVCVKQLNVPTYPPIAWAAQLTGVVHLKVTVGAQGKVTEVEGSGSSPVLVDRAKANVKDWTFCAPEKNESKHLRIQYDYRLVGASVYRPPNAKVVIDLGEGKVLITLPPGEPQP